jgi:hypothetical protein
MSTRFELGHVIPTVGSLGARAREMTGRALATIERNLPASGHVPPRTVLATIGRGVLRPESHPRGVRSTLERIRRRQNVIEHVRSTTTERTKESSPLCRVPERHHDMTGHGNSGHPASGPSISTESGHGPVLRLLCAV